MNNASTERYWNEKFLHYSLSQPLLFGHKGDSDSARKMAKVSIPFAIQSKVTQITSSALLGNLICYSTALSILINRYTGHERFLLSTTPIKAKAESLQSADIVFLAQNISSSETVQSVLEASKKEVLETFQKPVLSEETMRRLEKENEFSLNYLANIGIVDDAVQKHYTLFAECNILFRLEYEAEKLSHISANYKSNIEESFIRRFLSRFLLVLDDMISRSQAQIKNIKWFSDLERDEILHKFNHPISKTLGNDTFNGLWSEKVLKYPDRIAVKCGAKIVTNAELDIISNKISRAVTFSGSFQSTVIGVLMRRSEKMVSTILGILKAGRAFLLIDVHYPKERQKYIIQSSKTNLIITDSYDCDFVVDMPEVKVIQFDDVFAFRDGEPVILPMINGACPAYVVYTSGSTGNPKGVMISHGGMLNHFRAQIAVLNLSSGSVIAQTSPASFVISVWQLLCGLISDSLIVIYDQELLKNPMVFQEEISRDKISILQLVPSYLSLLLANSQMQRLPGLSGLQKLFVTGEELQCALAKQWFDYYPQVELINGYGMSEASDDVSHLSLTRRPTTEKISLGKIIANNRIYVLSKEKDLCPVDVPGEIYIAGMGVGLQYINDFDSNDCFEKDPFDASGHSRRYRTGDRGVWDSDGSLYFLGRSDRQVKIKGIRVELGEIEAAIKIYRGVQDTVVLFDENVLSGLIAFVISDKETASDTGNLKLFLKAMIPEYMIPHDIIYLSAFPLTPNGKIDKAQLLLYRFDKQQDMIAEQNTDQTVEKTILNIWKSILGATEIEYKDNFFTVGGNSFKVLELHAEIEKKYPGKVEIYHLFSMFTIEDQARHISRQLQSGLTSEGNDNVIVADF